MSRAIQPKRFLIGLSGCQPVKCIIYDHTKKTVVFRYYVPIVLQKIFFVICYVPICLNINQNKLVFQIEPLRIREDFREISCQYPA